VAVALVWSRSLGQPAAAFDALRFEVRRAIVRHCLMVSSSFKLRPYQKAAVNAVLARYSTGTGRRALLYLPTGAGKTVIATFTIKALRARFGLGRTLFVAHRREILDQTQETIERHLPGLTVAVEQGERTRNGDADIVVASVQSLLTRKERYDPTSFDIIVCDECHRALSPSWEQVIDYFLSQSGARTLLLGMTATPRRSDGRSVLERFGETAFEISRTELEDLGYLVPIRYFGVQADLRLDRVAQSAGDFQVGALSRIMDTPLHRALAVKAWQEQGSRLRTIAFCAGVEHAQHLADDFQALGVAAAKIDGKTPDRGELLSRFRDGSVQVLTNYGVLTEGFDDPVVACILMTRPTTSPLVYTQCIGRGLRPAPGKSSCAVIDLIDRTEHPLQYGVTQMTGLATHWRSRGGDPLRQAEAVRRIKVTSPEAFLRIRQASCLEEVQEILVSLPAEVVVAGLDGHPVLRYQAPRERPLKTAALAAIKALLREAQVTGARVTFGDESVQIAFRQPESENERYAHLRWHLERVSQRRVEYAVGSARVPNNPRALLKSMLPAHCGLEAFDARGTGGAVAKVSGLLPDELASIAEDFEGASGVKLELKGQLSLF
jgi:ATP-dependent helicase IRC3